MGFEFENILNYSLKGIVLDTETLDKISNKNHDELILIRAIEINKDAIAKDPRFLLPFTRDDLEYLYKHYCSTTCYNLENVSLTLIRDAINLAFLHS